MQCVVRVAPIRAMPAGMSVFDYAWTGAAAPAVGSVITIPFRASAIYGLVVEVIPSSPHSLKAIPEQTPLELVTPAEVEWLRTISERVGSNVGSLIRFMLPPLTKRTSLTLSRPATSKKERAPTFRYAWYFDRESHVAALETAVAQAARAGGPVGLIVPTHERAKDLMELLSGTLKIPVYYFSNDSAPERRKIWMEWTGSKKPLIVIGTHLPVWLPHVNNALWIVDEPTHPYHEQWDGVKYTNTQIIESRRRQLKESTLYVAHSPATEDLHRITTIPELLVWPTIVDRTTEDPRTRSLFLSPSLESSLQEAKRIIFFVPHLQQATHSVCRDCGELFALIKHGAVLECTSCKGTNFHELGYGAKTLVKELEESKIIGLEDHIDLVDAKNATQLALSSPLKNPDSKTVVIATGPLFDRMDLSSYDMIVDLTADFELLHPEWSTEEIMWHRLRAMSASLARSWAGTWYIQARKPDLRAWRVQNNVGYMDWLRHELPLRKRFGQPPYTT